MISGVYYSPRHDKLFVCRNIFGTMWDVQHAHELMECLTKDIIDFIFIATMDEIGEFSETP